MYRRLDTPAGTSDTGPRILVRIPPKSQQPVRYLNRDDVVMEEWSSDDTSRESTMAVKDFGRKKPERFNSLSNRYTDESRKLAGGFQHRQILVRPPQSQQPVRYPNIDDVVTEEWSSDDTSRESTMAVKDFGRKETKRFHSLSNRYIDESQRKLTGGFQHLSELKGKSKRGMKMMREDCTAESTRQPPRARGEGRGRDGTTDGQRYEGSPDLSRHIIRRRRGDRRRDGRRLSPSDGQDIEHFVPDLPRQIIRRRRGDRRRDGRRLSPSDEQDIEESPDLSRQTIRRRGGDRRRDGRRLSPSDGQDIEGSPDLSTHIIRRRPGDRRRDGRRLSPSNGQDIEDFVPYLPRQIIRRRRGDRRRDGRRLSPSVGQDIEQLPIDLIDRHSAISSGSGVGWDVTWRSSSSDGEDYETDSDAAEECNICMEAYDEGHQKRYLPCCHCFHGSCIDQWLKEKTTCPICRIDIHIDESTP